MSWRTEAMNICIVLSSQGTRWPVLLAVGCGCPSRPSPAQAPKAKSINNTSAHLKHRSGLFPTSPRQPGTQLLSLVLLPQLL